MTPTEKAIWRCELCGGVMSRTVPQGMHAVRLVNGKTLNCVDREVAREETKR